MFIDTTRFLENRIEHGLVEPEQMQWSETTRM